MWNYNNNKPLHRKLFHKTEKSNPNNAHTNLQKPLTDSSPNQRYHASLRSSPGCGYNQDCLNLGTLNCLFKDRGGYLALSTYKGLQHSNSTFMLHNGLVADVLVEVCLKNCHGLVFTSQFDREELRINKNRKEASCGSLRDGKVRPVL